MLAPVVRGQKGEYKDLFADLARAGYVRARVNGQVVNLSDDLSLDRQIKHHIEVVIDRLEGRSRAARRGRLAEAVEQALKLGEGTVIVAAEGQPDLLLSSHYACTVCGIGFDPPSPQLFSFNSPQGMCLACDGLGIRHDFDPDLLVPDPVALGLGRGDRAAWAGQGRGQVAAASVRRGRGQPRGRPGRSRQGNDAQGALAQPRREVPQRLALRHRRPDDRPPLEEPAARSGRTPRSGRAWPTSFWPGIAGRVRRPDPGPARAVTCGA